MDNGDTTDIRMARADRLKRARMKHYPRSGSEAARAMGVIIPTYLAHESGRRAFDDADAAIYARHFGVTVKFLFFGDTSDFSDIVTNPVQFYDEAKQIPVLDIANADAVLNFLSGKPPMKQEFAFLPSGRQVPPDTFSAVIRDKAMTAPRDGRSVAPSDYVFFKVSNALTNDALVLAYVESRHQVLFRQLRIIDDRAREAVVELRPLNPEFEIIRMTIPRDGRIVAHAFLVSPAPRPL